MLKTSSRCTTILFALFGCFLFAGSQVLLAATFSVTSANCEAPGGLYSAIVQANGNPGPDIIDIATGLVIKTESCPKPAISDDSTLQITESLTIKGNSATLHGSNFWVDDTVVNRFETSGICPRFPEFLIVGVSRSLFMIGERGTDNTGIEVTIEDLAVDNVSQFSNVRDGAKLTLRNVSASDIMDLRDCLKPVIEVFGGGDLVLENVSMHRVSTFKPVRASGMILGETGKLEIYDSEFGLNRGRYAISWRGNADIVNSTFRKAGGVLANGPGIIHVINSLFETNDIKINSSDGFKATGGSVILEASTVVYSLIECESTGGCINEPSPNTFQAHSGDFIAFDESVLHVQTLNPIYNPSGALLLEAISPGFFSASPDSFIQPLPWQDATALKTITGQPALLTGTDALPVDPTGPGFLEFHYPDSVTPIITGGAILVDKIPDAGTGGANELKDPRGNVITHDILGHPRVDSTFRSIGAVQNNVIPHLVAGIGAQDPYSALLSWTKPNSAGITGYDVCHGTGTPPDPGAIGTGCPGTLLVGFSTSATDTTGTVSGLPLASTHWFLVRAYAGVTKEGWSNVASVQTPVTVTYPPTSALTGISVAPVVTGPLTDPLYQILTGTLPPGLTLNPSTGEVTGRTSTGCGTTVGILVISNNGILTTTAITFSCDAAPIATLTSTSLIVLIMLLAGVGLLILRRRIAF